MSGVWEGEYRPARPTVTTGLNYDVTYIDITSFDLCVAEG